MIVEQLWMHDHPGMFRTMLEGPHKVNLLCTIAFKLNLNFLTLGAIRQHSQAAASLAMILL